MTSPDMDDEAMKAMARRIVRQCYPKVNMAGAGDLLKVALAAIIETQERCAGLAETRAVEWAGYGDVGFALCHVAAAIRSGQQFRKDV